eukprot:scaffold13589_cov64-Phaeocystis_antarctica.AAC.6
MRGVGAVRERHRDPRAVLRLEALLQHAAQNVLPILVPRGHRREDIVDAVGVLPRHLQPQLTLGAWLLPQHRVEQRLAWGGAASSAGAPRTAIVRRGQPTCRRRRPPGGHAAWATAHVFAPGVPPSSGCSPGEVSSHGATMSRVHSHSARGLPPRLARRVTSSKSWRCAAQASGSISPRTHLARASERRAGAPRPLSRKPASLEDASRFSATTATLLASERRKAISSDSVASSPPQSSSTRCALYAAARSRSRSSTSACACCDDDVNRSADGAAVPRAAACSFCAALSADPLRHSRATAATSNFEAGRGGGGPPTSRKCVWLGSRQVAEPSPCDSS